MKVLIFLFIFSLTSCLNKTEKNYQKLKSQNSSNEEFLYSLLEFDANNPDFFTTKLEIGMFHLAAQNYYESYAYLEKARKLMEKGASVSNDQKAMLFSSLAALKLIDAKIDEAWEYAQKSYSVPKSGKRYGYLCGRILTALEKNEEALEYFNECYEAYPDNIDSESARAYMYLLTLNTDYGKARELLEVYIEKGKFFPGLGLFASGVYEKCGDLEKSIYSAFLDYEYHSCFGNTDDKRFVSNLNMLEEKYKLNNFKVDENARRALQQIKSLYSNSPLVAPESDFYISQYILLREKIRCKMFSLEDYNKYLTLEKYFSEFPSYYWYLMTVVPHYESSNVQDIVIDLCKKIISLDSNSIYVSYCRSILGKQVGLSEEDSKKIRLTIEIQNSIFQFVRSENSEYLEDVYEFLSLPDCSYLYNGVMLVKNSVQNKKLRDELETKFNNTTGRLKERLSFILS